MTTTKKITRAEAVRALKTRGLSTTLRRAVKDGRVTWTFKKSIAFCRFKRLTATPTPKDQAS
jgi:hypothetical protein